MCHQPIIFSCVVIERPQGPAICQALAPGDVISEVWNGLVGRESYNEVNYNGHRLHTTYRSCFWSLSFGEKTELISSNLSQLSSALKRSYSQSRGMHPDRPTLCSGSTAIEKDLLIKLKQETAWGGHNERIEGWISSDPKWWVSVTLYCVGGAIMLLWYFSLWSIFCNGWKHTVNILQEFGQ